MHVSKTQRNVSRYRIIHVYIFFSGIPAHKRNSLARQAHQYLTDWSRVFKLHASSSALFYPSPHERPNDRFVSHPIKAYYPRILPKRCTVRSVGFNKFHSFIQTFSPSANTHLYKKLNICIVSYAFLVPNRPKTSLWLPRQLDNPTKLRARPFGWFHRNQIYINT